MSRSRETYRWHKRNSQREGFKDRRQHPQAEARCGKVIERARSYAAKKPRKRINIPLFDAAVARNGFRP